MAQSNAISHHPERHTILSSTQKDSGGNLPEKPMQTLFGNRCIAESVDDFLKKAETDFCQCRPPGEKSGKGVSLCVCVFYIVFFLSLLLAC
jgi:hypothetical protein